MAKFRRQQHSSRGDMHGTIMTLARLASDDPGCVLHDQHQGLDPEQPDFLLVLQLQARQFFLDSTGSMNRYGFNVFLLLTLDEGCAGMPVAMAITERRTSAAVFAFLDAVFAAMPELQPVSFMIDMDEAERGGIEKLARKLGCRIEVRWCLFHIMQKLREKVSGTANAGVRAAIITLFHRLRCAATEQEFQRWAVVVRGYVQHLRQRRPSLGRALHTFFSTLLRVPERWTLEIFRGGRLETPTDHLTNNVVES